MITVFALGYQGWGNNTRELRRAVDAVERGRGFRPPVFVDVRASRSSRARGFSGPAFERLVGKSRYRWFKQLGNEKAPLGDRPPLDLQDPSAISDLLDLALEQVTEQRRIIVLSSCPFPRQEGRPVCHRESIKRLLVREARKRDIEIEVVEWPGGDPVEVELTLPAGVIEALEGGRTSLDLGKTMKRELAALPWASIAKLRAGERELYRVVGPEAAHKQGWVLPVLWPDAGAPKRSTCQQKSRSLRRSLGLAPERA